MLSYFLGLSGQIPKVSHFKILTILIVYEKQFIKKAM